MPEKPETAAALSLLSADAVRQRAHRLLAIGLEDGLAHFRIDLGRLDAAADLVVETTRAAYPGLDVPFHSRWRHFAVGGQDRWAAIDDATPWDDEAERARAAFDLAITSVLLDAGAGPQWAYRDPDTGASDRPIRGPGAGEPRHVRAGRVLPQSLRSFAGRCQGARKPDRRSAGPPLSSDRGQPVGGCGRVARRCSAVSAPRLRHSPRSSRASMRRDPAGSIDHLAALAGGGSIAAPVILSELLRHLGAIWPSRLELGGIPLGDCWRHPAMTTDDATSQLVPLHKLSQWLAYSLIEPLQAAGIEVTDIDGLTGLAEYRNGGLFIDTGVLTLRDPGEAEREHDVGSALIVEWRALTVALLDRLADIVRQRLRKDAVSFPLARILQGGTWAAGRAIARRAPGRRLAAHQGRQRRHRILISAMGSASWKASPSSVTRWCSTS